MNTTEFAVHPIVEKIRNAVNTRSNQKHFEDDIDWRGIIFVSKDCTIKHPGQIKQRTSLLKAEKPIFADFGMLWALVLRTIQEGPPVRNDDDNPNKWEEGKPRHPEPLKILVFNDMPDEHYIFDKRQKQWKTKNGKGKNNSKP